MFFKTSFGAQKNFEHNWSLLYRMNYYGSIWLGTKLAEYWLLCIEICLEARLQKAPMQVVKFTPKLPETGN